MHRNVAFAVAWAHHQNKVFESLKNAPDKIRWGVIGTHFSHTHWKVLDWCMRHEPNIGFIFEENVNAVFHPKIYVFWTGTNWDILIGSANLTVGGMSGNTELVLYFSSEDTGPNNIKNRALKIIRSYWDRSHYISKHCLQKYRERWNQENRKSFVRRHDKDTVELLTWSWKKYYEVIRKKSKLRDRTSALLLLQRAQNVFSQGRPFHKLDSDVRRALAGSVRPKDGEWSEVENGWFGFTSACGYFTEIIYDHVEGDQLKVLGEGLDHIPVEGVVCREAYLNYIKCLKKALYGKPQGLGVGARLLTIKRPDTFTPWNSQIKRTLEQLLNLKPRLKPKDYERYWDEVITPIHESEWCDSPQPKEEHQVEIWRCRVAMLDVLGWNAQ